MPLFEYKCEKCNLLFERLEHSSEAEEVQKCPNCDSVECKRLISQSSFNLKGGGWAKDGYSNKPE